MSGNIFGDSTRDDDRALIVGVKDRIGSIIAGSVGIDVEQEGIGNNFASSVEVAMVDPKGAKSAPDSANVTADIVINVEMEDLSVKDWEEIERELQCKLEEDMAERCQKKLSCFQKTRSGVLKKGDMAKVLVPVNSPLTLEELVYMIDVSVSSKYGSDLEGITRTLTDGLRSSL
jgi:hypothetical protein